MKQALSLPSGSLLETSGEVNKGDFGAVTYPDGDRKTRILIRWPLIFPTAK